MLSMVFRAVRGEFKKELMALQKPIARASTATVKEVGDTVVKPGMRAAIARAGFSTKWQNAARVNYYPKSGTSINAMMWAYHKIGYAGVFEDGAKIAGDPLLWIPIAGTAPARIGTHKTTPANYEKFIGPLHSIRVAGKPPMLAAYMLGKSGSKVTMSKLRRGSALSRLGVRRRRSAQGSQLTSVPIFIGVRAIHVHARFNLKAVWKRGQARLAPVYLKNIARENKR